MIVGDSRQRQLRDAFFFQLTRNDNDNLANRSIMASPESKKIHQDMGTDILTHSVVTKIVVVRLDFVWATDIAAIKTSLLTRKLSWRNESIVQPDLLLLGSGAWTIRECRQQKRNPADCLNDYKK
jgi:hypothetical protein